MPNMGKLGSVVVDGAVTGPGAITIMVEGSITSVIGDLVSPHGTKTGAHAAATVTVGSVTVIAEGRPVDYLGSVCSCGDVISNNCAITVQVGI